MNYRFFLGLFLIMGCQAGKLPKERLKQYELEMACEFREGETEISLKNTLKCPVRIWIKSAHPPLNRYLEQMNPISLGPLRDTLLLIGNADPEKRELQFASRLGDTSEAITHGRMQLPFKKNRAYRLIQGNASEPTHNTDWSRYALDFGLGIGDTICAAADGYVVGVVQGYRFGGKGNQWKDYGNFITLYHPEYGLYTQYAHLKHRGALVGLGDKVDSGQAIGLAGMTGQTSIEHLHFNTLKPAHTEAGLISIQLDSIGGYKVSELRRNELIQN